jgi:hypothetical protein
MLTRHPNKIPIPLLQKMCFSLHTSFYQLFPNISSNLSKYYISFVTSLLDIQNKCSTHFHELVTLYLDIQSKCSTHFLQTIFYPWEQLVHQAQILDSVFCQQLIHTCSKNYSIQCHYLMQWLFVYHISIQWFIVCNNSIIMHFVCAPIWGGGAEEKKTLP